MFKKIILLFLSIILILSVNQSVFSQTNFNVFFPFTNNFLYLKDSYLISPYYNYYNYSFRFPFGIMNYPYIFYGQYIFTPVVNSFVPYIDYIKVLPYNPVFQNYLGIHDLNMPITTPMRMIASIEVTANNKSLYVGESLQLRVEGTYYSGSTKVLTNHEGTTYFSSDPNVVIVSDNGLVRAIREGTTNIKVINSGVEGSYSVTVPIKRKPVFLIKDKNWRDVLCAIPIIIWTEEEIVLPTHVDPGRIIKSPFLIYHEEDSVFDADSAIYFMQQYIDRGFINDSHIIDQRYEEGREWGGINTEEWLAQSFVPEQPVLSKVDINVKKRLEGYDLIVSIRSEVNGPDLASVTIPHSQISTVFEWVTADFMRNTDPKLFSQNVVYLQAGSTYYIVLRIAPGNVPQEEVIYCWRAEKDDRYSYGMMLFNGEFKIDADAAFRTYYPPVVVIGDTHRELDNLLVDDPPLGVGLSSSQICRINLEDYTKFWHNINEVVVVDYENYQAGLMASVFASYGHIPLLFLNAQNVENYDNILQNRKIFIIDSVDESTFDYIAENAESTISYSLSELETLYKRRTRTKKAILVNHNDLGIKFDSSFKPQKSSLPINEIYSKTSLAAPILASSRHEVIFSCDSQDHNVISQFLKEKIGKFLGSAHYIEYLTIIASPNAIPMIKWVYDDRGNSFSFALDRFDYANIDSDLFVELAVGRIYSLTLSDVSSYIARVLFYPELTTNSTQMLFSAGIDEASPDHQAIFSSYIYALNEAFNSTGYITSSFIGTATLAEEWKNKGLIVYYGHGNCNFGGIGTSKLPELKNAFVITSACETADFYSCPDSLKHEVFAPNVIRKGGIGFIGRGASMGGGLFEKWNFLLNIYSEGKDIGKSFMYMTNIFISKIVYSGGLSGESYILLGDPLFKLETPYNLPKSEIQEMGFGYYNINIYNMYIRTPYEEQLGNHCILLSTLPMHEINLVQVCDYPYPHYNFEIKIGTFLEEFFNKATIVSEDFPEIYETYDIYWDQVAGWDRDMWIHTPYLEFKPNYNGIFNMVTLTIELEREPKE